MIKEILKTIYECGTNFIRLCIITVLLILTFILYCLSWRIGTDVGNWISKKIRKKKEY